MQDNQKQWDVLWINAELATMAGEGYGIIANAALAIKNGHIAWLGAMDALPGLPETLAQEVRNAKGRWLTPGLIDCHTHLVYAGNRATEFEARLAGKTYAEIAQAGGGILSTVRATRAASDEELLQQSARRLKGFLREGVTTIEIKSGYGLDLESEMKMLRVARKLGEDFPVTVRTSFLGAHSVPPEFAGDKDAYIAYLCEVMLPALAEQGLVDAVDGFCEHIAFSPQQLEKLFAVAAQHRLPVKLHAEQLSDQGGAAFAAQHKALSADHLEYASEDGIRAMAEVGTAAVLLPGAFHMLREKQHPPLNLLRKYQVPMALASDANPGTSPVGSLLLMLNMGCILFGLQPVEALQAVTCNAARALGLQDTIGTLEVGKQADIALWEITHPSELSYHLGYNPCVGVSKRGVFRSFEG